MLKLIFYIGNLSLELAKLLGVKFVPGRELEGFIGKTLSKVFIYHNQHNYDARDYTLTKLSLLRDELKEIEKYSSDLLVKFKNLYRKQRITYHGFRTEVSIASLLIRTEQDFLKTESPD